MANGFQSTESAPDTRTGYNGTASAIPEGTIVKLVAAGKYRQVAPIAAEGDVIYGVAGEEIAAYTYGLIVIRGTTPVLCSAALTVGGRVGTDGSGAAIDWNAASSLLGVAVEVGATGVLAEVELIGPGAPPSA